MVDSRSAVVARHLLRRRQPIPFQKDLVSSAMRCRAILSGPALAISYIARSYEIEKMIKRELAQSETTMSIEDQYHFIASGRQELAVPVLTEFRQWIDGPMVGVMRNGPEPYQYLSCLIAELPLLGDQPTREQFLP
jgi:hypothetical protein